MRNITTIERRIELESLRATTFEPFGQVIEDPAYNASSSRVKGQTANQGSAVKYPDVSALENRYSFAPAVRDAHPTISLFRCSPRASMDVVNASHRNFVPVTILERHPYTTQSFIPLGLSPIDDSTCYVVVVARSRSTRGSVEDLPDLDSIRAFVARGSQAVTYGPGTWHAPMIVVGKDAVTFIVLQYVNGVAQDDCDECEMRSSGLGIQLSIPISTSGRPHM